VAGKPSKDRALEALDFVISVLKEHEKDLDRLINKLGQTAVASEKVEKVEERISSLQTQISDLVKLISSSRETPAIYARGPPVIIKCKKWDEFKALAKGADTISISLKEAEKTFQADALKDGRIVAYAGKIPEDTGLLKVWLSKELGVSEEKIFEGVLTIG
jgi:hypothetical protein